MKRLLAYPLVSLFLGVMWLVLNGSVDSIHILLGTLFGLAGGAMLARLQTSQGTVQHRLGAAAALSWLFFLDIVRSNVAVLKIVIHPNIASRTSGFIAIPLQLRNPGALAVLACIITATPGTSWARYDSRQNVLTIHVLDLIDEQAWIEQFKDRYERRLMEIFQ